MVMTAERAGEIGIALRNNDLKQAITLLAQCVREFGDQPMWNDRAQARLMGSENLIDFLIDRTTFDPPLDVVLKQQNGEDYEKVGEASTFLDARRSAAANVFSTDNDACVVTLDLRTFDEPVFRAERR